MNLSLALRDMRSYRFSAWGLAQRLDDAIDLRLRYTSEVPVVGLIENHLNISFVRMELDDNTILPHSRIAFLKASEALVLYFEDSGFSRLWQRERLDHQQQTFPI